MRWPRAGPFNTTNSAAEQGSGSLAADAQLTFRQENILTVQSHHFRGAESMHEHQTHNGQVARGAEAGPEARHFLERERHNGESGFLHPQPAEFAPRSPQAQRPAVEEGLMEAVRHLTRGIGELVADGTIGGGRAGIDGRGRRRRLLAGLEAHVIE